MLKLPRLLLLAAIGLAAYYFFTHYRLDGLENIEVKPLGGSPAGSKPPDSPGAAPQVAPKKKPTIRIATANLGPLDRRKLDDRNIAPLLGEIIRRYDVVAVQDVRAQSQGLVLDLLEIVNRGGAAYDFAIDRRVGREPVETYAAYFFDRAVVEIDRTTVCEVNDPADQFLHKPLVAAFRVRGPRPEEAFTFTLINVQIDPAQAELELDLLAGVFRAVRGDGRGEDDVIVLGSLGADEQGLGGLGRIPHIMWSVAGRPTTTLGTRLADNILFDSQATTEFVGRSGVLDLVREFDLTIRQAIEVSDHLPVWAEFSSYEGGQVGRIAEANSGAAR